MPTKKYEITCLQLEKFERYKLCHAELLPLLVSHEEFLLSWINVCDILCKQVISARILVAKKHLN